MLEPFKQYPTLLLPSLLSPLLLLPLLSLPMLLVPTLLQPTFPHPPVLLYLKHASMLDIGFTPSHLNVKYIDEAFVNRGYKDAKLVNKATLW